MKKISSLFMSIAGLVSVASADEAGPLQIAGAPTVAPYAAAVADMVDGQSDIFIHRTNSHHGMTALCAKGSSIQIAATNRPMLDQERSQCAGEGVEQLVEIELGYDGIVFAQSSKSKHISLTARDIYLAVARQTPRTNSDCVLVPNRRKTWKDVRSDLPKRDILVFGPPNSTGSWNALMELVLKEGARSFPCLAELESRSPSYFTSALDLRRDGMWVDGGENDFAVAHTLRYVRDAIGIFGFAHLSGTSGVEPISFNGVEPSVRTLNSHDYSVTQTLYLYVRADRLAQNENLEEIIATFSRFDAIAPQGRLVRLGLVPSRFSGRRTIISTANGERQVIGAPKQETMAAPVHYAEPRKIPSPSVKPEPAAKPVRVVKAPPAASPPKPVAKTAQIKPADPAPKAKPIAPFPSKPATPPISAAAAETLPRASTSTGHPSAPETRTRAKPECEPSENCAEPSRDGPVTSSIF
ncbi:PstS family phosphate ABC transporter substrate-binding protein [Parvularcula sp. LCG005]|uniref:PstS family phosphate ABC transporter substrate-binding protein n=1 Tax=Parvularcula sp. LCG005 TaxID=3078805 RepID=UPI002942D5CD|nr:substrate-binding domain-containing protein [Parvularcula sp. LCG005]WOI53765.1 substrate-binding domain-containing protein [Parvularcula sp. LCG005]